MSKSYNTRSTVPTMEHNVHSRPSRMHKVFEDLPSPMTDRFNKMDLEDENHPKVSKSPLKDSTKCVVERINKKVLPPRSEESPEQAAKRASDHKDISQVEHLTTNVTLKLLDQLHSEYETDPRLITADTPGLDLRVGLQETDIVQQLSQPCSRDPQHEVLMQENEEFGQDLQDNNAILKQGDMGLFEYLTNQDVDTVVIVEDHDEFSCADLLEVLPHDTYQLNEIVYGTPTALEELAQNAGQLKSGTHGVFTNQEHEYLKIENKSNSVIYSTPLGKGSFGEASLCIVSERTSFVKKKITQKFNPDEVLFTHGNIHPHIIQSFALILREGFPEIIMEYAGQSLLSYRKQMKLEEEDIWNFTFQLFKGLSFLSEKMVIHFDIKPENLFIKKDTQGMLLKIGDFGSVRLPERTVQTDAWTPEYMSPEMCKFFLMTTPNLSPLFNFSETLQQVTENITAKSDVFPAGLVVGFMYKGEHLLPYHFQTTRPDLMSDVKRLRLAMIAQMALNPDLAKSLIPKESGPEMRTLQEAMLAGLSGNRSSAQDILDLMNTLSSSKQSSLQTDIESNVLEPRVLKIPVPCTSCDGVVDKQIMPRKVKSRTRKSRCKSDKPIQETNSEERRDNSVISETILAENPQLKKRLVKSLMKRKLEEKTCRTSDKKMKTYDETGVDTDFDVPTDGGLGYGIPLEEPFPELPTISEYQNPVCQAEDGWPVQESVPGNMPALDDLLQ